MEHLLQLYYLHLHDVLWCLFIYMFIYHYYSSFKKTFITLLNLVDVCVG